MIGTIPGKQAAESFPWIIDRFESVEKLGTGSRCPLYHCTLSSFLYLSRGKKEKKKGKGGEARVSRADITNNTKYVISSEMEMEHVRKHERIVTLGSRCGVAPGTPIPGPFGFSKFRKPFSRWRRSTIKPSLLDFWASFSRKSCERKGKGGWPRFRRIHCKRPHCASNFFSGYN